MFFTPSLNVGGIERVMLTYAQGFVRKGYSVVYVICHGKGTFTSEFLGAVKLINLETLRLRHSIKSLARVFRIEQPDVVFTANDATLFVLLAKWLAFSHCKIITSQHSYITNEESNTLRSWVVIRFFFRFCYRIIAVSEGIKRMLVDSLKLPASKVITIYNPIDIDRVISLAKEQGAVFPFDYLVFVGRLSPVKNISFLLESFAKFMEVHPDVKLVIVGDGEEKKLLLEKCEQLNIKENIVMTGLQSNPYPYLKHARIVVLPSLSEALPTVLIESMVLGKTIVATPTLGAQEIISNQKLGYISTSFTDSNEFASLLNEAFERPKESFVLCNEVQKYQLDKKMDELQGLLFESI